VAIARGERWAGPFFCGARRRRFFVGAPPAPGPGEAWGQRRRERKIRSPRFPKIIIVVIWHVHAHVYVIARAVTVLV